MVVSENEYTLAANMSDKCSKNIMYMKLKYLLMASAILLGTGCRQLTDGDAVGKQEIKLSNDRFTAEALWAMGRIGSATVNSDNQLAYTVSYYSVEKNKGTSWIRVGELKDGKLTTSKEFVGSEPAWTPLGLAYLKGGQLFINERLVDNTSDLEGFIVSPDGKKVILVKTVKAHFTTADKYADLPQASGRIVTDLMYKHWDEWVDQIPHPFVADLRKNGTTYCIENEIDILDGEPYESPMRPWGGVEQLAWSPDGTQIAYTCRKKTGIDYALSTNSDIYLFNIEDKTTINLTEGMMGYDTNPQFSPDGNTLAWLSMEREGYESDENRLFVMDLASGEKRFLSKGLDSNVDNYYWEDDQNIVFNAVWHGVENIYNIDLTGVITCLVTGQYDHVPCATVNMDGRKTYICLRHSMCEANEIYAINIDENGEDSIPSNAPAYTQLTFENKDIYDQVTMGTVKPRWQKTTDGKEMLTWVIYPPHFDPNKKYPTLLYCEGGPQSPVSQFWSVRWNFMMMAAHDYIVVAPNRHGLPGFGLEWNEQISGDYGGQCMRDYFTAIDEFCNEPYVDTDHLGCVGASFGGFSVYWIAGNHDGRFKAFIAHDGIFNMEMQYLETEEMWFANWDMGGAYWEKDNKIAQRTFANSPHKFVDKWDTPILCIHGEKDYRILANQAMAAFDAAKLRGVDAELLIFPDENHWVLKPQNGILWQRTFFEWLDKYLK